MRIAFFSTRPYDRRFFDAANEARGNELVYFDARLDRTTVALAEGFDAICVFVNDNADADVIERLSSFGVKVIALRCAGFNNIDLAAADARGIPVVRVPAYSPEAVAEHTFALVLGLVRHIPRAYNRVREGDFHLNGLLGFDLSGKTLGIVGVGKIGKGVARIGAGFGMRVLACDPYPAEGVDVDYVPFETLLRESDIVTLHAPLTPETHHLIDREAVAAMKPGATLVNTSRGGLVDTAAVIAGLKSGAIGRLGLDVYEEEADLFFEDLSDMVLQDDVFSRLLTFPNVIVTGHQGFFTHEALTAIAETTLANIGVVARGEPTVNGVTPAMRK